MNARAHWPPFLVFVGIALFAAAAACFPGGPVFAPHAAGFRWGEDFLCALFQPRGAQGADNPARTIAFAALGTTCLGLGVVFFRISRGAAARIHRSTIEIGGIGTAVYAMFVPTVLHHVAVAFGFVFSTAAYAAIVDLLRRERRRGLSCVGLALLLLQAASAISYYGDVGAASLPSLQQAGVAADLGWVLAVYYRGPLRR